MKIQVLGGHGGLARGALTTSYLIDDKLLIDAGAVAAATSIDQQIKIEHILISHCHLDHIKDLAFLCDNCFGLKKTPFEIYTHETVARIIKTHLLNDVVWPDFSKLPDEKTPTIRFHSVAEEKTFSLGEYKVTPVKVKHAYDAMGFIVEGKNSAVIFTLDTGPTERIWQVASKVPHLKAIFTEVSFPNQLQKVAEVSDHHTASSMKEEIKKMPQDIPIILTHLKPNFRKEIEQELKTLNEKRIKVLEKDGEVFRF